MKTSMFLLRNLEAKASTWRMSSTSTLLQQQQQPLSTTSTMKSAASSSSWVHNNHSSSPAVTAANMQSLFPQSTSAAPNISIRYFHSSRPTLREQRRRRRRISSPIVDDDGESTEKEGMDSMMLEYKPVTDLEEFRSLAQGALAKLVESIEPMKAINDPYFQVDVSHDMLTIELDPANGSFIVEIDEENRWMTLQSPVSGAQSYFYSKRKGEWVGAQDYHSMEGLFVRDLIRLCKGVPKL